MKNISLKVIKEQMKQATNYYPENQYKTYIINTNLVTRSIYSLVRPFMPAKTVSRMIFVGTKVEEIQEALLREMDL